MRTMPRTSAEIERLLMRWPLSIHLKRELKKAQIREARKAKRARSKLMGIIKGRLKALSISDLKEVVLQLEPQKDDL